MVSGGVKILQVRGIPIRLHWTFFLILPYVAFIMARRFQMFAELAETNGEALILPPLAWGFILAVLLFASVLLHELGHVFVALMQGSKVRDVTLMLLGGVSHIEKISKEPRAEAKMAVIGPIVSIALAGLAYGLHHLAEGVAADLRFGLYYLAQINLVVGIFNLLPAFPLDGGRVLRSLLEPRNGRVRATAIAAGVGKVLAVVMGFLGLLSGNFLLVLIAVFVWAGGAAEAAAAAHTERLAGVKVGELAEWGIPTVDASDTLERAAELMLAVRATALLVRGSRGEAAVVTAQQIGSVPERARWSRRVGEVVRFDVSIVDATQSLERAMEYMAESGHAVVPVSREGAVAGVISQDRIARFVQLESMLRPSEPPPERRAPEGRPTRPSWA